MSKKKSELEPLVGQRQNGESDKAIQAVNDWLRLGAGRTLPALLSKYAETHQNTPPTKSLDTLKQWSSDHSWAERAAEYDQAWEERKNAQRERVLRAGLALDFRRVIKLTKLAKFLEDQVYELSEPDEDGVQTYHNIWVPDVKSVRDGDNFKLVDFERFNPALVEQYRETLNDIAKEVGGRVQKQDITSGGEKVAVAVVKMPIDDL
jgi:hypothetical protein